MHFEASLAHADAFIYFSHARLSPPPRAWTVAAHRVGARSLGTLCTEWTDGEAANGVLAWDGATGGALARAAAAFAFYMGFDGWLVNIETALVLDGGLCCQGGIVTAAPTVIAPVAGIVGFVRALRDATRTHRGGLTIWYDSVDASDGAIGWASALDVRGEPFFDAADGIFLDYHWDEERLATTVVNAGVRARDVCVGVDVWGRGMIGGGGWRCGEAAASATKRGLSVALFAPAWTYEARGGYESIDAARRAEERLWHGREAAAITISTPSGHAAASQECVVVNASGLALEPALAAALSDVSRAAAAAAMSVGWSIKESGGNGWTVLRDDAWPLREEELNRVSDATTTGSGEGESDGACDDPRGVACFATSYAWCSASQVVPLPNVTADAGATDQRLICVSEWIRGGPPNTADPYELRLQLLNTQGEKLGPEQSSGKRHATDQWCRITLLICAPVGTASVLVTHGGQDAEGWAGHFGVRMRALRVRIIDTSAAAVGSQAQAPQPAILPRALALPPSLSQAVGGPRSVGASLPLVTHFNVGAGSRIWHRGIEGGCPWFDISMSEPLPPRLGQAAARDMTGVTLGGLPEPPLSSIGDGEPSTGVGIVLQMPSPPSTSVIARAYLSHSCAWMGGTSLFLSVVGADAGVTCVFDILSFSLPLESLLPPPLYVTLITQSSHATWAVPLVALIDGVYIKPIRVVEGCARTAEGWANAVWEFAPTPPSQAPISSLCIALCHANDVARAHLWVRVGYAGIAEGGGRG